MASEAKLLTCNSCNGSAARPRRYAEVREAWSSTCPLNCAWEDAIRDDLVRQTPQGCVVLTESRPRPARTGILTGRLPSLLDRAAEYRTGPPP